MPFRNARTTLRVGALALAACTLPFAQAQVAGELRGRVLDVTGAAVAGAHVTLTQTATGIRQSATSSADGLYDFPQLVSGTYSLHVESPGFATYDRSGITIATGGTVGLDAPLAASGSDAVTVNSDAPLLQSQTSNIATTVASGTVQALPLNTRNFIQLAQLAPGVALPPGTLLPRINGGRPRTNEYLFDGISALQPEPGQVAFFPIVDSISEFTVEANNVPAEYGRFNGGVVNVATRSGSNQIHGSLFEYFRNEDLNARNWFATSTARKPMYRRNLFGATLGAPILHDRLFFFGDYQGVLQRIGVTRISTVPTVAQRAGIFTGTHIYNPSTTTTVGGRLTRTEFPNDVINVPLDPAAVALLARFPLPTSSGAANNYTRTANDDDHQQQFDTRIDAAHGQRDRGFARYTYYHEVEQPATPLPDGSGAISGSVLGAGNVTGLTHITGQQVVLNETHTFNGAVLNNFRLGYTRRGNTQAGTSLGNTASNSLGIPGIPTNAAFNNALPLFTLTGFAQLGPSASTFSQYQTAVGELVDTVQWVRGAHSVKAGFDLRRYELNAIAPPNPTGSFAFTTTGTNIQGATGATGGNALASFLLGQVDTFSIDLQARTIRPRDYIHEFFVQDDWRMLPNLTINAGLRWSLHLPSTETHNQGAIFNLATQQLDYLGMNGNSRSARELHWGNVAPRFGLAYSPDTKTVLRAGFGIVFIDQSGITTPFTTPQYPFIQNVQQKTTDSYSAPFKLSNGPTVSPIAYTPDAGLGQSVYTATRKAGSGYVQQWNLALQRAITNNLSVEVAYVGSHIVHVGIPDSNLNQLTAAQLAQGTALTATVANPYFGILPASSPLGTRTIAAGQLLKPYPRFQNVSIYRNNTGQTNYNAIEAKVEQRMSHNLSLLFGYTHSKLIDDASSVFSSTVLSSPNSSSLIAADTYRPYLERDSSNGDMPNVLTLAAVYALPKFAGHGLATAALGGWTINTVITLQSGMPVTVTQSTNTNSFAGVALMRPNQIANPSLPKDQRTKARFFNTAAFATTPQFQFGSASRNPVRGPAYRDGDLSLIKHTRIGEKTDVEFRAELFDVTNTPGFAQPNGSFGTTAFGSITATVTDPRVAQFALRLSR
ncbi:TonB-dependent receptor [Terriglobus roseus]|uniref:Carboxypeptidase regulatory-like domain-containing protein n=1 Tax=Terriglobus roseus TaxID=392734 RepID=A0A1H4PPQ6_9BACT|nr:carboxypeptidase-like regulatory domain-containing protein [Terriglobus roseus]SEC09291.1 Carboxypeptidase regulatory-like domain-containing protein [Terriglobus roseus]